MRMRLYSLLLIGLCLPVQGQVLRDPAAAVEASQPPLVLRSTAQELPDWRLDYVIESLRDEMREVADSSLTEAEKAEEAERILSENPLILRAFVEQDTTPDTRTPDEIIEFLQTALYEVVVEIAPTEEVRSHIKAPAANSQIEPNRPILVYRDPLAPIPANSTRKEVEVVQQAEPVEVIQEEAEPETEVKVAFLKDAEVTTDMHDDDTVLSELAAEEGDLVLFDRINIWVGGAVQFDAYSHRDLLNLDGEGTSTSANLRRGEVILRSSYHEQGEVKVQYDIAEKVFRDFYWRWQFKSQDANLTVGQQKEPMGFDYLMGNKFGTAMERSSASSEFSSFRSTGVRLNRWIDFGEQRRVAGISATRATASVGVFTRDIGLDSANDTDVSLTGRATLGNAIDGERGLHVGIGGTYRQGNFDSVAPRPEMHIAERIQLAEIDADELLTVALETGASFGSVHGQAELFVSKYSDGPIEGDGWGGYAQVGWFITGEHRDYRPRVGLWAPVNRLGNSAWEVFTRFSFTKGDSEFDPSNHLAQLSGGVNWYFRQFRSSVNLLYAETDRPVEGYDDGAAIIARVQYLF